MIVGNGFLAKNLKKIDSSELLFFASGVSNSLISHNDPGLKREKSLLNEYKQTDKKLIYFGTSSIYDCSRKDTAYVMHKRSIEEYIQKNFNDYLILRLPLVIGKSNNRHTLINYSSNCIVDGNNMRIEADATRYLIDIDDVVEICNLLASRINKSTININFSEKISVLGIVKHMEEALNKKANFKIIPGGSNYNVKNQQFISICELQKLDYFSKDYYRKIIFKYFQKS